LKQTAFGAKVEPGLLADIVGEIAYDLTIRFTALF
jgi:hypothetical protein